MPHRIRELREKLGLTQAQFADRLGVTQPTVSRWESGAEPELAHLALLAGLANKPLDDFAGRSSSYVVKIETVSVLGAVEAGAWQVAVEWPVDSRYEISWRPDPRYDGLPKFGLEVHGPSMNDIYPEGSTVICVRLMDIGREPESGERVIVYQKRLDGLIEATVKAFVRDPETGEIWLWPRSNHPHHQTPIRYPDGSGDIEEVLIHAIVIGSFRPEPKR